MKSFSAKIVRIAFEEGELEIFKPMKGVASYGIGDKTHFRPLGERRISAEGLATEWWSTNSPMWCRITKAQGRGLGDGGNRRLHSPSCILRMMPRSAQARAFSPLKE